MHNGLKKLKSKVRKAERETNGCHKKIKEGTFDVIWKAKNGKVDAWVELDKNIQTVSRELPGMKESAGDLLERARKALNKLIYLSVTPETGIHSFTGGKIGGYYEH